jgi:hypothetical protein
MSYSDPYRLIYYYSITNQFPGGSFKYVREISLIDEHEFFLRIVQSVPLMEKLSIVNEKNSDQSSNILIFFHSILRKYIHIILKSSYLIQDQLYE